MDRELDQINVIPLVDVMLVLLVIVLDHRDIHQYRPDSLSILPKPKRPAIVKMSPIVITLNAEGNLFVNDRPVTARRTEGDSQAGTTRIGGRGSRG